MSKNINIEAHVKRYLNTELSDVVKLTEALNALVASRRETAIAEKEKELELLKSGGIPESPKPAEPKTRGARKNKSEQEAEG